MYDLTWLYRGAQSALFYYVSCAPCTKYTSMRKRRKQNERDRKAREAFEADAPEFYRQPSPYRTNEYWNEEISLGPGPPPKRSTKKQRNARSKASKAGLLAGLDENGNDCQTENSALSTVKAKIQQAGELWNSRRYQREDEELWGTSQPSSRSGGTGKDSLGSTLGLTKLSSAKTARSSMESFYYAKNPPLNDLHPPVVSNPSSIRANNRWMLQPPPSAKVMGGYEKANRSRSNSGNSGNSNSSRKGGDMPLSRQVGERMLERRLKTAQSLQSQESLRTTREIVEDGQDHDRDEGGPSHTSLSTTLRNESGSPSLFDNHSPPAAPLSGAVSNDDDENEDEVEVEDEDDGNEFAEDTNEDQTFHFPNTPAAPLSSQRSKSIAPDPPPSAVQGPALQDSFELQDTEDAASWRRQAYDRLDHKERRQRWSVS